MMEAFPPKARWREESVFDREKKELTGGGFYSRQTQRAGEWVAYCSDDDFEYGHHVIIWGSWLPENLSERLDLNGYMFGPE